MDLFYERTKSAFCGYFNADPWFRTILELQETEPAVHHAMIAFGGLNWKPPTSCTTSESVYSFSARFWMEHYSLALRYTRLALTSARTPTNVVLVCSLIFIHLEAVQEHFETVISQVHGLIGVLTSRASKSISPRQIHPAVAEALIRLDVQCSLYRGSHFPRLASWLLTEPLIFQIDAGDLVQVRRLLDYYTSRMLIFMRETADRIKYRDRCLCPLEALAEAQKLAQTFREIDGMLLTSCTVNQNSCGQYALQIRAKLNAVISHCCVYPEASIYDLYTSDFNIVLELCKILLANTNIADSTPSILLDESILHPLATIATLCRDGSIRHEALDQFARLVETRQSWHVNVMYHLTRKVVQIEEDSERRDLTCVDIPEWRRIHSHGFDGLQNVGLRSIVTQFKSLPNGSDGDWNTREERIYW